MTSNGILSIIAGICPHKLYSQLCLWFFNISEKNLAPWCIFACLFFVVSWSWLLRKERVEIAGGGERWKWKNLPNVAKQSVETYSIRLTTHFWCFSNTLRERRHTNASHADLSIFLMPFSLSLSNNPTTWLLLIFLSLSEHQERLLASFFTTVCWKAFQLISLRTCLQEM